EAISLEFCCPFIYVNRVGGEDEILFDGRSFVQNGHDTLYELRPFEADAVSFELPELKAPSHPLKETKLPNTWEDLFEPKLNYSARPCRLVELSDEDCKEILEGIIFGFQEYARKSGFKKFLVALSG